MMKIPKGYEEVAFDIEFNSGSYFHPTIEKRPATGWRLPGQGIAIRLVREDYKNRKLYNITHIASGLWALGPELPFTMIKKFYEYLVSLPIDYTSTDTEKVVVSQREYVPAIKEFLDQIGHKEPVYQVPKGVIQ